MMYLALGFFSVAVGLMVLDFVGVTPGAAGVSNMALLATLLMLGLKGLTSLHHHWRELHPVSRH